MSVRNILGMEHKGDDESRTGFGFPSAECWAN